MCEKQGVSPSDQGIKVSWKGLSAQKIYQHQSSCVWIFVQRPDSPKPKHPSLQPCACPTVSICSKPLSHHIKFRVESWWINHPWFLLSTAGFLLYNYFWFIPVTFHFPKPPNHFLPISLSAPFSLMRKKIILTEIIEVAATGTRRVMHTLYLQSECWYPALLSPKPELDMTSHHFQVMVQAFGSHNHPHQYEFWALVLSSLKICLNF